MEDWGRLGPGARRILWENWFEDTLREQGLDPDDYDIRYERPPDPETGQPTDHAGAYDWENNDFYINPENFEGDYSGSGDPEAHEDANAAMETGAHEARHAQQQDVYEDYGVYWPVWGSSFHQEDAGDFADSYVPDPDDPFACWGFPLTFWRYSICLITPNLMAKRKSNYIY